MNIIEKIKKSKNLSTKLEILMFINYRKNKMDDQALTNTTDVTITNLALFSTSNSTGYIPLYLITINGQPQYFRDSNL